MTEQTVYASTIIARIVGAPFEIACQALSARAPIAIVLAALLIMGLGAGTSSAQETSGMPSQEDAPEPVKLLALGDSLTAGFGLAQDEGFTAQLEQALTDQGFTVEIVNAGVSGDTTAGGRARLGWILDNTITHAMVALGANDALRGLEPDQTQANLRAILEMLQEKEIPVLLAGMLAPRNLGPDYGAEFDGLYPALAEEFDVVFYPFFLEGVAAEPSLNQADGIHPNPEGVAIMVDAILPYVVELIEQ